MRQRLPDDAAGIEHRTLEARPYEMGRSADLTSQDDAAVAPAEATAHDLLERDIARVAVKIGDGRDSTHHRRRPADIELDLFAWPHGRERVVQSKTPHPMKALVPKDWAKEVDAECKATFEAIGKVARSYIQALQTRGAAAMKAQVRSGKTGEALTLLITDADVEFYTKEYVDSAVEAWTGVASVKMK